jgi:hypothetical protein
MEVIVLQQSRLCSEVWDAHGMLAQHCMASSGVDIAKQSNAYAARVTAITVIRMGLATRICL